MIPWSFSSCHILYPGTLTYWKYIVKITAANASMYYNFSLTRKHFEIPTVSQCFKYENFGLNFVNFA